VSTVFPEYERQLVEVARRSASPATSATGVTQRRWLSLRIAVPVLTAIASVAILVGAAVSLHSSPSSGGTSSQASLQALLGQYAVLRRPQTAADRALAGKAPVLGGTSRFGAGSGPGLAHQTVHYRVFISGLSHYEAIPRYTRVVLVGGLRVALFVERYVRVTAPPTVRITGNDPRAAQAELKSWERLQGRLRLQRGPQPDLLAVRVNRERARAVLTATDLSRRDRRRDPGAIGSTQVTDASLPAPGGRIVAIEPDGVTVVVWHWPREWDASVFRYLPPTLQEAPVYNNVAIGTAPTRFDGSFPIPPYSVTLDGPTGAEIARYVDSGNSPSSWLRTSPGSNTASPGPETPQSRTAERNPASPNPVFVVPASVRLATVRQGGAAQIEFKVLLNARSYYETIVDEAGARCIRPMSAAKTASSTFSGRIDAFNGPYMRGATFSEGLGVLLECAGHYRVSMSVIGRDGRPDAPFGSATLTVTQHSS
jgi:hypothetical protein